MKFNKVLLLMTLLLSACVKNEELVPGGHISAVMESEQTKTSVTDEGSFTWSAGDKVWIGTTSGGVVGTLSDGAGTSKAEFTYGTFFGEMTGNAVYPYNSGHKVKGNELSVVLPASYDLGTSLSNTNAVMYGVNVGGTFQFSHLAGVMRFKFKNVPAGTDRFQITLDKKVNGTFVVDLDSDQPVIEAIASSEKADKTITMNFAPLKSVSDIALYIPLPIGTYTSLALDLWAGERSVWTYSNAVTNTISRRTLKLMPTITLGGIVEGDIVGDDSVDTDLFVFAGQSNMMGAAHFGPSEEVFTEYAHEYKYVPILKGEKNGKFVYAQHPAGEWHYMDPSKAYGPAYLDVATGKSKLTNFWDHTYFAPATRSLEKAIRSQSEYDYYPSPSMPPYFAKYYTEMGNKCVYAHMAKGACEIVHYFTADAVDEYNRLITDYNSSNSTSYATLSSSSLSGGGKAFDAKYFAMLRDYAEFEPNAVIANKCFVWLQGESDKHNYVQYKLKLQALWSHLQSIGFTHFFILRVGYWGSAEIINEIKAQEDFCTENENCYIITRAPSLIPYPGAAVDSWWMYEPFYEFNNCRDSYITNTTNHHFNEKAFKIFARKSADNIHRVLHLGLDPLLEEENIKGMIPDDDNNDEPIEGEELTPIIISGAFISSQQVYTVEASSCVHVFKVIPGAKYYLTAEKGPAGVDSNRNLIYAPIEDIKDVVPGAAVKFASGYTERIVVYANDNANGASDVFTVPSDCNYIAVSSYKGGAIITVIGPRADYYYGGIELYTVVEGAYLGNVVPTKFTSSSSARSQIFAVEPNTTYKATAVNENKQIVYVLLRSDSGLTINGSLDYVSSNPTGARTVGEKNEPQIITTPSDCHFIAFSGYKGSDGKYQHVILEKVE